MSFVAAILKNARGKKTENKVQTILLTFTPESSVESSLGGTCNSCFWSIFMHCSYLMLKISISL